MTNSLLQGLQQASTIRNTKGGEYYATSYNSNLDFFAGISRFQVFFQQHMKKTEKQHLQIFCMYLISEVERAKEGSSRLPSSGFVLTVLKML